MRHTALDTDYASDTNRNELHTMFAIMAAVRPVEKSKVQKQKMFNHAGLFSHSKSRLVMWWRHQKQGFSGAKPKMTSNSNPQRAASPLMSHRPAGRRAPGVQSQQALFAVLDQMGARHTEAQRGDLFGKDAAA